MDVHRLVSAPREVAPDGCEVAILAATDRGSMAQFRLEPTETAAAVVHRTVHELWFVRAGTGELWRRDPSGAVAADRLEVGVSISIPVGTQFQVRCTGEDALEIIGVSMPRWPGEGEAELVEGPWESSRSK